LPGTSRLRLLARRGKRLVLLRLDFSVLSQTLTKHLSQILDAGDPKNGRIQGSTFRHDEWY